MKKKNLLTRPLAALTALLLALTLVPTALAATEVCPYHSDRVCSETIIKKANCHEEGVAEYSCPVAGCTYKNQLKKLPIDPTNHDAVYTDNGDNTHSGVCNWTVSHSAGLRIDRENHTYSATGVCEKCGSYNYSKVTMNLPDRTAHIALNDTAAKLTAGEIKLLLGSADITKDYDLSYSWYYQGNQVGTDQECPLPATVYGREGVYYYTLYVMAVPKGTLSRQPVSESCTITVQVEELVSASAIITTEDTMLRLDQEDYWSADPISSQIYESVKNFCGRNADPSYVVFDVNSKSGTSVGDLDVTSSVTQYSFSRVGSSLDDVRFLATGTAGDYSIGFTAYDTAGQKHAGILTITVQQYVGDMDVLYIAAHNEAVTLSSEDFERFWEKVNPRGMLDYISFNETPRSVDGVLYTGYTSATITGDRVRTSDQFYVEPGRNEYGIDSVTFLPGVTQNGYITVSFTAFGTRGSGYTSRREGTMYIFFSSDTRSADVSLTVSAAGTALDPTAFQKAYQSATGGTGASFYIQLLDVPASGALYAGRTSTKQGVRLTEAAVKGRPFAYNGTQNETISSLTYVPGTAASESIRYVASSAQGKALYAGKITFTSANVPSAPASRVSYECTSSGVTFRASDFENLPGVNATKLNMVSFKLPSAAYGTLYWGRTAASAGTPITNEEEWYSVASTAVTNSVNNITFVPAAGYVGLVTISFDALNNSGDRSTGVVQITVKASTTTNPGNTTNPGTNPNPGTNLPVKTFSDVPKSEWFYTYVTDLTTTGVLSGYPDGTFKPDGAVKLGEALKMIMTAAGYSEQPKTGDHWASGYLTRAKADNLLPAGLIENLDRTVNRYDIAQITSRAMKLAASSTSSPFADMQNTEAAAPYVMSLYDTGVITGDKNKAGQLVFNGTYAIRRSEFAAIIWRVQNYVQTGNVNGTTAP